MIPASAVLWRPLVALAAVASFAARPHATSCGPGPCALTPPTPVELRAMLAEADRLLTSYADDSTPLGRACHGIGATMKAHAAEVRMSDYMWLAVDPDGNLGPVTGDVHGPGTTGGAAHVHIARGFDALNPDRGLAAILQTARHEFAHLNGVPQRETWHVDAAAELATACGPRGGE